MSWLRQSCNSSALYLGEVVLDWCRTVGLPETPEGERLSRTQLQELHGPAFAVTMMAGPIERALEGGVPVLVDAAFRVAEVDELTRVSGDLPMYLLGIEATFETRCGRLAVRAGRPLTRSDVKERDQLELTKIGIGDVMARATRVVHNDRSLEEYHRALRQFLDEDVPSA